MPPEFPLRLAGAARSGQRTPLGWRPGASLRPKTFALLRYLVEHPGQLLTKAALLEAPLAERETTVSGGGAVVVMREFARRGVMYARRPRFIETVLARLPASLSTPLCAPVSTPNVLSPLAALFRALPRA